MGTTPTPEPFPFPTSEKHDAPPEQLKPVAEEPSEEALDNGVEESFPASDPVSVTVDKVITPKKDEAKKDDAKR
jgi:hypothetical protein